MDVADLVHTGRHAMKAPPRVLARLGRAPLLHFCVIGGLLYLADAAWQQQEVDAAASAPVERIVFSARQVEQLRQDMTMQYGFPPSPEDLQAAVDAAVDDEVLYRQALAIGLDRDNESVRQRLIQIGGFVAEDPDMDEEALYQAALGLGLHHSDLVVRRQLATTMRLVAENVPLADEVPPDQAALQAYLEQHAEAFTTPARVSLTHVYLSADERGAAAEADARRLLGELRDRHVTPDRSDAFGDPFLLGYRFQRQTHDAIGQMLGGSFVQSMAGMAPGEWAGPVRSAYGWHLIWIEAVEPAELPPLAQIEGPLRAAILAERREQRMQDSMEQMRAEYLIEIETTQSAADHMQAGEAAGG
ncbi:MAG TPA: peptidyl-prolyl cis-trans isomerase [Geminicoccus sp.]|uniref:peptidylprolyl isomerase n=1 Tax=Geminicoccus sp. TaxID=2024832 RepID=UPI002C4ED957|nr:peptidyl-prolyl cis-trans isomerase [Geminicoccus sp.]HWL70769.1 peptidyl-prolyl cis-trans isomerase [Geminicoccus sp.]